jgi:hypothetical protein
VTTETIASHPAFLPGFAVRPVYDTMLDGFAAASVHGNHRAHQERAAQQLHWAAKASRNLGLT